MKAEEWARQAWDFYEGVTGPKGLAGYFERAQQEARTAALEEAAKAIEHSGCDCNFAPCAHDEACENAAARIRTLLEGK